MKRIKNSDMAQTLNGQPQPIQPMVQSAMFYPNAYLTFNQNGNYIKHYYNGTERICSRLGDQTFRLSGNVAFSPQTQQRLGTRIMQADQQARADLLEVVEAGDVPIETPSADITSLQPANPNANSHSHSNTGSSNDIFYYHTNHLGSTAFVTDNNATVTQGFLYAPFGEITTEYAPMWQNGLIPNYAFNAKELDEETGMYYYEARYYNPPVFVSRDAHFERYFWTSPYGYCNNNSLKYVDPTGMDEYEFDKNGKLLNTIENKNADILRVVKTDRKGNIRHDKDGNKKIIAEQSFDYGTISVASNVTMGGELDFDKFNATILNVNEDMERNRLPMFEFLSQNTHVEWGTLYGEQKNGDYFGVISTSRSNKEELASIFYLESMAFGKYKGIYECFHSHPLNAIGTPSGYSHMEGREPYGSGDHGVAIRYDSWGTTLKVFDASSGHYYQYYKGGYK